MEFFKWNPDVVSNDGLWVKKDAANKRLKSLYLLIGLLNIMIWIHVIFK